MKKVAAGILLLFTFLFISCAEKITSPERQRVVASIEEKSWFELWRVTFTDSTFKEYSPGWIEDRKVKPGDTLSVFLSAKEWPNRIVLLPKHFEELKETDTQKVIGTQVSYEDSLGLFLRVMTFVDKEKGLKKHPCISLCRGEYEYYICN